MRESAAALAGRVQGGGGCRRGREKNGSYAYKGAEASVWMREVDRCDAHRELRASKGQDTPRT